MSEGNRPRGMAGGWCQSAERGEALAGGRERRGKVAAAARRGGARLWRPRRAAGLSPLPASGPSHSHAGPRPLGLLPPRGHQSPGEEDGPTTSCFRQRDPEAILTPLDGPRTQRETSPRPTLQNRSGEVAGRGARGNSRGIWKACVLAPPGVRLAVLRLLRTRMDLVTQISHIYTLPRLCLLPAGSVVGITKRCALRKLLQQFYCNISILTSQTSLWN